MTKVECHVCHADITDHDVFYHYSRNHSTYDIPRTVLILALRSAYETIGELKARRTP